MLPATVKSNVSRTSHQAAGIEFRPIMSEHDDPHPREGSEISLLIHVISKHFSHVLSKHSSHVISKRSEKSWRCGERTLPIKEILLLKQKRLAQITYSPVVKTTPFRTGRVPGIQPPASLWRCLLA
jgi:hypothetical protein